MADLEVDCCVVGAGFAGLTAAHRLRQAGQTVAVLEARDRVGGRTHTVVRDDGAWIDRGGAWVGPGQDRIYALMEEFGVEAYKQYTDGEAMMVVDGKQHRYEGTIPLSVSPWAIANLGTAFFELGQLCKDIPLDAPWEAKKAQQWDRISLAQWLHGHVLSKQARELLDTAIAGCYTSASSEVSFLFVLHQMASGGGPGFLLGVKDGAEDARPVGGMGAIYRPLAEQIGTDLHLEQPVRLISQDDDGVTVRSDELSVRARRAIVAVPIAIAGQIEYEPLLPTDRHFLHQRLPSGAVFKTAVLYDEPFWRADGLSGQSAAPGSFATITIDGCTDDAQLGNLTVITEGPIARQLCGLDEAGRREAIIDELAARFGERARKPIDYVEQNWTMERYSGGGMLSHAPTGVLTQFGPSLRQPCGRIHWAGTETSSVMCGWIDGAVRSGERAAREVTEREATQLA